MTITSFTPISATAGDSITLTGTFDDPASFQCFIGPASLLGGISAQAEAAIVSATATTLVITIPPDAFSGYVLIRQSGILDVIAPGTLTVNSKPGAAKGLIGVGPRGGRVYKTGRTRTIRYSGNLVFGIEWQPGLRSFPDDCSYDTASDPGAGFTYPLYNARYSSGLLNFQGPIPPPGTGPATRAAGAGESQTWYMPTAIPRGLVMCYLEANTTDTQGSFFEDAGSIYFYPNTIRLDVSTGKSDYQITSRYFPKRVRYNPLGEGTDFTLAGLAASFPDDTLVSDSSVPRHNTIIEQIPWSVDWHGIYSYTINVMEVVEVTDGSISTTPAGEGPWGLGLIDGPHLTGAYYYSVPCWGGSIIVSASLFDGSDTAQLSVLSADTIGNGGGPLQWTTQADAAILEPNVFSRAFGINGTGGTAGITCTVSDDWGNSHTLAYGIGGGGADCSGGASATASSGTAVASVSKSATRHSHLQGRVRTLDGPIPASVFVDYSLSPGAATAGDGTIDLAGTQGRHTASFTVQNLSVQSVAAARYTTGSGYSVFPVGMQPSGWILTTPAVYCNIYNLVWTNGPAGSSVLNEQLPARIALSTPIPGELGDDTRIVFSGEPFSVGTLDHLAYRVVVPAGDLAHWTLPAGITASTVGGLTQLVIGIGDPPGYEYPAATSDKTYVRDIGGNQSGPRTFGSDWSGGRFLSIPVKCDRASQPIRIAIFNDPNQDDPLPAGRFYGIPRVRVWDLVTGPAGVLTTLVIDLCAPSDTTGTGLENLLGVMPYQKDTKWPVPTLDNDFWGVSDVHRVGLERLTVGATYSFGDWKLLRQNSYLSLLPSAPHLTPAWQYDDLYNTGIEASVERGLCVISDGRIALDEEYLVHAPSTTDKLVSIRELLRGVKLRPMFTFTPAAESLGYPHFNLPAAFLGGAGATVDSAGTWTEQSLVPMQADGSAQQIGLLAQCLYDEVDFYPEYAPSFPLRFNKILRGGYWGIVLGADPAGVGVFASETDGAFLAAGGGTTDENGQYVTGAPYARAGHPHRLETNEQRIDSVGQVARFRGRYVFNQIGLLSGPNPGNTSDPWGYYYAYYISGGNVIINRSDNHRPPFDVTGITATTEGNCREPLLIVLANRRLILVYTSAGVMQERTSDYEGETWSAAVAGLTGSHPAIAGNADGAVIRAVYSAGAITGTEQTGGDSTPGDPFTFANADTLTPLAVKNDKFGLSFSQDTADLLLLHVGITGEAEPSNWWSADNGRNWHRSTE